MIYHGDALNILAGMKSESVDCVITSPPYWGLRDYGVDGQIGLEPTPELFIGNMRMIFEQVRRVLTGGGTLWLNLGDSYANSGRGGNSAVITGTGKDKSKGTRPKAVKGLKPKDLIGIPWRVALALRDDGWYLRQDIIWHKPNPMPESVTDRCTKSHEYIFLLTKSDKYYFDSESILEPFSDREHRGKIKGARGSQAYAKARGNDRTNSGGFPQTRKGRNKRSVWSCISRPFRGAHFATFPEKLIEPCVLAGCPAGGIVLDPFFGAGTVGLVAKRHGRQYIGIELNKDYIEIAKRRIEGVV